LKYINRIRDIIIASLGLFFLSPFLSIIALAIKRDSPGPAFYRGLRAAKGGGNFKILKFRTMYEHPNSYNGVKITAEDDPRITPIGQWLRNTKLNELPQLWNVLKGDMSLVGPRPEDPEIVAQWPEELRKEILSVRPGITSPASVLYRDEESMLNNKNVMETYLNLIQPSKIRLDQLYVRNHSSWLDLDVILWTALVYLPRLESYKPPERLLFIGPLSKFRHRFINWFTIDLLIVFSSFGFVGLIRRSISPIHIGWANAIIASFCFAVLFSIIGGLLGVQRIHWSTASVADIFELLISTVVALLVSLSINLAIGIMPPLLIVMASIVSFMGFVLVRYRERLLVGLASRVRQASKSTNRLGERVLIVGCGDAGLSAAWLLENNRKAYKYSVIGFIDDDIYKQDIRFRGIKVLGTREDIPHIVEKHDVGIIIYAIHNIPVEEKRKILEICESCSAHIVSIPNILAEFDNVKNGSIDPVLTVQTKTHTDEVLNPAWDLSSKHLRKWLQDLERDLERGNIEEGIIRIKELQERLQI
jgi:lipopolysaccharide/colanic/teichoic acid biosynthesis glycosyltransferase